MSDTRPTLVYDGDCGICRYWVGYWRSLTGERVVYRPYQEAAADFPAIPPAAFRHAIQFIEPDGHAYSGAAATFRVLRDVPGRAAWWWLIGLFALYLSYVYAGQDFLRFQWDTLLLEAGFLAIFVTGGSRILIWLFRWLIFRYLLLAGAVKLLSGDASWRALTALDYHFWTQPLPSPLAWSVWRTSRPPAVRRHRPCV